MIKASVLFYENYSAQSHIIINQGGTSSGKTYAILQALFCFAADTENLVITVVGQDMPNLRVGAFRDAKNICSSSTPLQAAVKGINLTDSLFELYNGSAKYTGTDNKPGQSLKPLGTFDRPTTHNFNPT